MTAWHEGLDAAERVIVALDCGRDEALALADALAGHARFLKVGMTLYYAVGPAIVAELKQRGFKVFVDLKLHDIPHQVEGAAKSIVLAGADLLTAHSFGGLEMMRAAAKGASRGREESGGGAQGCVIGVTVLTSMDDDALLQVGVARAAAGQVELLASLAAEAGLDGVVCSPAEASRMRQILGDGAWVVTPGVRPVGADVGDQARVATPASAIEAGASHIVVGRPITQAQNPVAAFDVIASEVASACAKG